MIFHHNYTNPVDLAPLNLVLSMLCFCDPCATRMSTRDVAMSELAQMMFDLLGRAGASP